MKKTWKIVGLDCANCAAKLENAIGRLPGVESVSVNFVAGTVTLSAADSDFEAVTAAMLKTAARVEPDAEILTDGAEQHGHHHEHHEHHHHEDDGHDECCHEHHHHHDGECACGCGHHHEEKPLDESTPVAAGHVRRTYPIEGLDCANCAEKLEQALAAIDGVESVRVSFVHKKVQLTCAAAQLGAVQSAMTETCRKVEPDAVIDFSEAAPKASAKPAAPQKEQPVILYRVAASVLLAAAALIFCPKGSTASVLLNIAAYLIAAYDVLWRAVRNISRGQIFDENFLMAVASVGSMCMSEFTEGVAVMALYQVGEWFQDRAVEKSRASISSLMDIRPDYANVLRGGQTVTVDPNEVRVGELIVVKPGEKLPLDGIVTEGTSSLNTVALTGESLPRDVAPGDSVISGCINLHGVITVKVTAAFGDSTVAKILELVESSGDNKAKAERFISKFARYYTPAVCGAALLLALVPPLCLDPGNWEKWITQALSFLVISCPCALVISVPLSFFSGIGGASRKGILIKGANYMEVLAGLDTVAFDKTGTLTRGVFSVTAVHPEEGISGDALLELTALAESYSSHPIAVSLRRAYGKEPDRNRVANVKEAAGHGIEAEVDGRRVLVGNSKLMAANGLTVEPCSVQGTIVYTAADGRCLGHIVISDELKPTSVQAMADLKAAGVQRLVMLTGDHKAVAEDIAAKLGMTDVRAELLPSGKVTAVESLLGEDHKVGFVGDGINDAPVLRRADLGIAMGAMGSDAAIEAADVVLMDDDPAKLPQAVRIARRTMGIVRQNIVFALAVKAVIMVLGFLGIANMWLAVFADVGVCMIAILNAMRAMRC